MRQLVINNYGIVDTNQTTGSFHKIRKQRDTIINNHIGQDLEEITEPEKTTILTNNPVTVVTNSFKIIETSCGYINENIYTSEITVNTINETPVDISNLTNKIYCIYVQM